jgi:hypothetical protein
MKLGRDTGSVTNHLYSRMTKGQPDPEVGMGATICHWTDRSAGTIIAVAKDGQGRWVIEVQGDHAKRVDDNGMSESQEYEYLPNPSGGVETFRFEDGRWCALRRNPESGRWNKQKQGHGLIIGRREKYHDFSF